MNQYIFDKNAEELELGRLRMIEAAVDADTIALLEESGITVGWRCLELGAGAGSIVEWMGTRVGPTGTVLAVDKKTAYLKRFSSPPYRVIEGDFLLLSLESAMDLLHARYVLIHNKQDEEMLRKIRTIVKPGGYVVLEEPDFTSAQLLNPRGDASHQRVKEAICRMFTNAGLNPAYGISLPRKLAEAGLNIVRTRATLHLCAGNSPIADVMAESALVLRKEYTGTGVATDQDIDRYVASANDAQYWSVYYTTVSIIARVN
jgi:ubiquinone/menaquinone biosynthesis C-methylase UbiE